MSDNGAMSTETTASDRSETSATTVTETWRYPVKSLMGDRVEVLDVEPWGPVGDRRWAVVATDGRPVTARTVPQLLSIAATATGAGGIALQGPRGVSMEVAAPVDGERVGVVFSGLSTAIDAGEEPARVLSAFAGRAVRLVWQPAPRERSINPSNGGRPGEVFSLADAGPVLLTCAASLRQLQSWVGEQPQLSMQRFRPNVVIDGSEPFAEDGWSRVWLGDVECRVQEHCDRCVMTTYDPATLERSEEPIRTMKLHRSWDGKTFFGIRLVPLAAGSVRVGAPVTFAA
jgi:uncharacterized protein YcbX